MVTSPKLMAPFQIARDMAGQPITPLGAHAAAAEGASRPEVDR